jgi:hypothetical protein
MSSDALPETPAAWTKALNAAWNAQAAFSKAADRAKKSYDRVRGPLVALSLAGGAICVVSHEVVSWYGKVSPSWLPAATGFVGSALLAVSAYLTTALLDPSNVQEWTRARAIAEAIKAQCFLFAVGMPPYQDRTAGVASLNDKINELSSDTIGIKVDPVSTDEDAAHPRQPIDIDTYVKTRTIGQRDWLHKNALLLSDADKRWRNVGIGLAVLSIVLGLIGSSFGTLRLNAWVPVVTTATASVTSYAAGGRFQTMAMFYRASAFQLDRLLADGPDLKLVERCEAILSRVNQSWMAEWSKQALSTAPTPPQPPHQSGHG